MTLGPAAFAAVLWGAVAAVVAVFAVLVRAIALERGWLGGSTTRSDVDARDGPAGAPSEDAPDGPTSGED